MTRRNHKNSPWTEERDDELRRLCAQGIATAAMANILRVCSKNAVVGRMSRLKLSNGRAPKKRKPGEPRPAGRAPGSAASPQKAPLKRRAGHPWKGTTVIPPRPETAPAIIDIRAAVGMLDHQEGQCRWPIDMPQRVMPFLTYCGAPVGPPLGKDKPCPYCVAHWRLSLASYQPKPDTRPRAA